MGPTGKSISVSVRVVRAGEAKLFGRESLIPAVARDKSDEIFRGAARPAGARPMLGYVGRCWAMLGYVGPW